jgi:hypothetical protein
LALKEPLSISHLEKTLTPQAIKIIFCYQRRPFTQGLEFPKPVGNIFTPFKKLRSSMRGVKFSLGH